MPKISCRSVVEEGEDPHAAEASNRSRRRRAARGHFVVYVGSEMTRFEVPTSYLKDPGFQQLLQISAEEYGFDSYNYQDRIVLACDQSTFLRLTALIMHKGSR